MKIKTLTSVIAVSLTLAFLLLSYVLTQIQLEGQLSPRQSNFLQWALNLVGATFFAFLLVGSYLRRTVVTPVSRLVEHAEQVAAGNYAARTEIQTHNELDALAAGFNEMSAAIECDIAARERAEAELRDARDKLEALAHLDGLTNLPNRRQFNDRLDKEWRRMQREQQELAVLMIDIDYFKGYNDHYGHGGGDECLKRVASALAEALVRPGDLVARYGGEEFVAILPATDLEGARQVAEHLRCAVEALALPHERSQAAGHVTVSIGCACTLPAPDGLPATLLESADRMLYQAKTQGRNQICG
jgi:diguanylate cyclase (GGDEF)-like protein